MWSAGWRFARFIGSTSPLAKDSTFESTPPQTRWEEIEVQSDFGRDLPFGGILSRGSLALVWLAQALFFDFYSSLPELTDLLMCPIPRDPKPTAGSLPLPLFSSLSLG